MNKIKERKLKAIKLEIEEIKNYIASSDNLDMVDQNNQVNNNDSNDTLTLTKIIKQDEINNNYSELYYIKKDLEALKIAITRNEKLLKEILLKIK